MAPRSGLEVGSVSAGVIQSHRCPESFSLSLRPSPPSVLPWKARERGLSQQLHVPGCGWETQQESARGMSSRSESLFPQILPEAALD